MQKRSRLLVVVLIILILGIGSFVTYKYRQPKVIKQGAHLSTIHHLTQSQTSNSDEKQLNGSGSVNQGTSKDQNGNIPSTPNPTTWQQSASGLITLKQPSANSTLQSGFELSGSASVSKVQYRLIDNEVGVISQGFISIVNGSFGATISFQPHASSGRLDVFSTNDSGAETNEVQIPVKF